MRILHNVNIFTEKLLICKSRFRQRYHVIEINAIRHTYVELGGKEMVGFRSENA